MSQELPTLPKSNSAETTPVGSILIRQNGSSPDKFPLHGQVVTIGRDERNDVVLDTDAVSRLHARLEQEQGKWYLTDLGSTNGTFLNTEKLPSYAPHTVRPGDRMRVGDYRLELYEPGEKFGTGVGTAVISPEFDEDEGDVEEISLARQLFGGLEESTVGEVLDASEEVQSTAVDVEAPSFEAVAAAPSDQPIEAKIKPENADSADADLPSVSAPEGAEPEQTVPIELPSLAELVANSGAATAMVEPAPLPQFRTLSDALAEAERKPKRHPYTFSVWPTVLIQGGQVIVSILNESNETRRFTVEMADAEGVACREEVFSAEIPAGAEQRTALNIHATTRPLFGDSADLPFQVVINKDSAETRSTDAIVRVEPRFTRTMAGFGAGAFILTMLAWIASMLLSL